MVEIEQLIPFVHITLSALLNPIYKLRSVVLAIIKPQPKCIGIVDSGAINMTPAAHQDEVGYNIRAIGTLRDDMAALKRAPAASRSHAPPTVRIIFIFKSKVVKATHKARVKLTVYVSEPLNPNITRPIVINL